MECSAPLLGFGLPLSSAEATLSQIRYGFSTLFEMISSGFTEYISLHGIAEYHLMHFKLLQKVHLMHNMTS